MGVPASGGFPGRARDPAEPQAEPLSPDSVKSETAGVPLGDMLPKLNQPKFLRRLSNWLQLTPRFVQSWHPQALRRGLGFLALRTQSPAHPAGAAAGQSLHA